MISKLEQICKVPDDETHIAGNWNFKPCGKNYVGENCTCSELDICNYHREYLKQQEKKKESYIEKVTNWWYGR